MIMNKQLRRNYGSLIVASILLLFLIATTTTTVEAGPSESEALKEAPSGMDLEDYFQLPQTFIGQTKNINNSATILKKGDTTSTDMVRMTNGDKQLASIWGRMATDDAPDTPYNYFDVTKEQTFSAWLYFGDNFKSSGDGMAFVVQNDKNGVNAISKSLDLGNHWNPQYGETLGVWAGWSYPEYTSDINQFASGAIQNSWALEFDTHHNDSNPAFMFTSQDNYFDGAKMEDGSTFLYKGQHIAWNYPAQAATYHRNMNIMNIYYDMKHNNIMQNLEMSGNDTGSTWHHFYLKYLPPDTGSTMAHIRYVFDDKNYDGSIRSFNQWNRRPRKKGTYLDIDTKNFKLKSGQTKLRWGFTAATGSPNVKPTTNAIVFESIPAVADISNNSSLYDITQEREILDYDQNDTADVNVNNGDKLEFDYDLNYNSGLAESGKIDTKIKLPQHVDFAPDDKGTIGKIIYHNKTVNITSSDLGQEVDNQVKINFVSIKLDSLGNDNSNIKIKLFGTADIGSNISSKVTNVPQAHTSFISSHYTGDVMSPQFSINPVLDTLKMTSAPSTKIQIQHSQSYEMKGTIEYEYGSPFDNDKLDLHTLIDGVDQGTSDFAVTKNSNKAKYDIIKKASSLSLGKHNITLYVSDDKHRFSNKVVYNITVDRDTSILRLQSEPEYKFQDTNQSQETRIVHRTGNWNLKVESLNSVWSLRVESSGLVNSKTNAPLAGGLVFRKDGSELPLKDNQVLLDYDKVLSNDDHVTDVSGKWLKDWGILLKLQANSSSGNYTGEISWDLTSSL
ncbi:L-type lectin family protein [Companilactobacillus jidongensis]|uniref:lectin-like domain-containing protein n=1 Tax=Companilactobacillus jidongensis TaxID=2486006 RepID=UPI000F77246C|nr:hypothetical protein [Companilactobacillus jidongensis]